MKGPKYVTYLWSLLISALFFSTLAYPSSKLLFPRFSFDDGTYTGLAIANLGTQSARVTLTAYGTDGSLLAGTTFQNPVEIDIPADQQVAKLISEIFQGTLPASSVGWVELTSSADSITGFFLFLNGQLTQLDGADLPVSAGEIVFNTIKVGNGYSTELNFINPGPTEIKVNLSLVQPDQGSTANEITLPARAVRRVDAGSLFGLTTVDNGTYLKAAAVSGSVAGFEFVRSESGDLLGLNAKDSEEALESIIFPQLVASGPWKSELGLINYTNAPTLVTITAHRSDGSLFGSDVLQSNPVTRGLEAGESVVLDLKELFGFSGTSAVDGWLQVEATDAAVNGYLSYGIPSVGSLAAIASVKEASKASVFSHMATASGFFTGVALLNQTSLRANTRIVAMTPEGEILGSYDTVLQPGERVSKLINELISETANRSNGFVWIHSDVPLYGSALFGAAKVLANVPAQEAPGEYKPDTNLPTLQVKPPIAVVQPGRTHTFSVQGAPGSVAWSVNGLPGGSSDVGTINGSGTYTAPPDRPQPSYITVSAESTNLRGGATVDILKADELLSGLGVLQSIVYLRSLQQLYEVELISLSALDRGASPAAEPQADNQSELFQVAPPSVKTSVRTFSDNIVKMLSYTASDGKEYVLMLGKDSGDLVRLDPATGQTRIIYTGLNSPTSMALDQTTGNVLVAEADRITEVAKSFLESGLTSASAQTGRGWGGVNESTVLPTEGVTGIEVDLCTGEIYYSVASEGAIYAYDRFTGETTLVVSGLSDPGQLLVVYRDDVPCPDSSQLLVAEPGADRISLVVPSLGALISWVSAPGVRDLVFLPPDNPFNLKASIAYGLYFDLAGSIGIVDVDDQYGNPPPVEEQPACSGEVAFDDPNLEAGVRQALGLQADEPITCELAASLTELHVPSREIARLGGIRYLENLEVLDVSRNLIRNLAPVGALTKLRTLNASYNLVESPGLSANLVDLTTLDLSHNLITDLDRLVNLEVGTAGVGSGRSARYQGILPSLVILDLSFNQIFDLSPLTSLVSLQDLDLSANFTITNINALAGLVNVQTLRLFQNSISEIDAISHLTALVLLDLSSNQVTDLHPLLENLGLGAGDVVLLQSNPVSLSSCDVIAALEARGVEIDIAGICAVDLDLSLTAQPNVARQGDLLLYTARVWNKGTEAAQGVTLDIDYPSATAFRSVRADHGTCQQDLNHISCTWDALGPGSIVFATLRVEVQSRSGNLESHASVAADQAELNMDNNEASTTTPIAEADLQVTKTISENPVTAGSYVTYTVQVKNLGPALATELTLTDKMPSDFALETFSGSSGKCFYDEGAGTIVCSIADLAVDSNFTLSIEGSVYSNSGSVTNSASVTLREYDPDPLNNRVTLTVPVNAPDLVVTKTDSVDPVTTGGDLAYTVNMTNAGNVTATNLVINDYLPAGIEFISADLPGGSCSPLNLQLQCTLPSLAPGANAVLTVNIQVFATSGTLSNTVTVSEDQIDGNSADNTATQITTIAQADLAITKTASLEPAITGADLDYQIGVTNNGPHPATGVILTDQLPAGVTYQGASIGSCNEINGVVQCAIGSLASGQSASVTLTVRVNTLQTTISNTASVAGDQTDPTPGNNSASVNSTVTQVANLAVSKTATQTLVRTSDDLDFNITITNNGPSDATGVVMGDSLSLDLIYDGINAPATVSPAGTGTCGIDQLSGQLQCTFPSIPSSATRTVTIPVHVNPEPSGALTIPNTATVAGNETDPDLTDNSSAYTLTFAQADLGISFTSYPDPNVPIPADVQFDYVLDVQNNGPHDALLPRFYLGLSPVATGNYTIGAPTVVPGLVQGSCTPNVAWVNCDLDPIPAGATVQITVPVTVHVGVVTVDASANIYSREFDLNSANNSDAVQTQIILP